MPALDRRAVAAWEAHLMARGAEPATANVRHRSLRRLGAWLADEARRTVTHRRDGPPKLDEKIVPKLSDDELRLLIKPATGSGCATGATRRSSGWPPRPRPARRNCSPWT